jgi:hypothetical protein
MERILLICSIDDRRALLQSTSPTRKARKRADLTDFVGESSQAGLAGGEGGIRTLGTGYPVRQISNPNGRFHSVRALRGGRAAMLRVSKSIR